jgi:hypothetical protein
MIKNQQNSVTKIYPHVGKKNYYYYFFSFSFSLIQQNEVSKSFFCNSKHFIINVQSFDEVKIRKKFSNRWGSFLVTHFNSIYSRCIESDLN